MELYPEIHRSYLSISLAFLLMMVIPEQLLAQITITHQDTRNPTLMYQGKPMFAVGPIPEVAIFAVEWGSDYFPQKQWLNWMQQHGLGYGRVYPESGYPWVPYDADKRVFPFKVVRWENGKPMVDITQFNPAYWKNFASLIKQCADRGIVLQMQLYQRVFFDGKNEEGRWNGNYFNPENNVNQFPVPTGEGGYGIFRAMTKESVWQDIHVQWVEHILNAIGNNGNVVIDLMNEGASYAVSREWIEFTLDLIENWEKKTGNDLLVGMDFDHYYKRNDPDLTYILGHPRMELIIGEGAEGHVVPDLVAGNRTPKKQKLATLYRHQYHKPFISTNSPNLGIHEGIEDLHLYQWYALMVKVQGAGVYAKEYPLDFSAGQVKQYAGRSKIQINFFKTIRDYASLEIASEIIDTAPGQYRLALASDQEAVVYLHTNGYEKTVEAGHPLTLQNMNIPDGPVSVTLLHPKTGVSKNLTGTIQKGHLALDLPAFTDDLAIHILSDNSTKANNPKVRSFTLVNAETDKEIKTLHNGDIINLAETGYIAFAVRANTSPEQVHYVQLELQGPVSHSQRERLLPYTLYGDDMQGDYYGKHLKSGSYTLTAMPYSRDKKGIASTITFQVVNTANARVASSSKKETEIITGLQVYPIPTSSKVHIMYQNQEEQVQMMLLDHVGKVLLSRPLAQQGEEVLDLSSFGKGIFYIKMISREGVETKRTVVK